MKKNLLKAAMVAVLCTFATACFNEDVENPDVYISGTRDWKRKDVLAARDSMDAIEQRYKSQLLHYVKGLIESGNVPSNYNIASRYSNLEKLQPDAFDILADGTKIGYIDLGLSVKWAVHNLGITLGELYGKDFNLEEAIENYPGIPQKFEFPLGEDTIVKYEDFSSYPYSLDSLLQAYSKYDIKKDTPMGVVDLYRNTWETLLYQLTQEHRFNEEWWKEYASFSLNSRWEWLRHSYKELSADYIVIWGQNTFGRNLEKELADLPSSVLSGTESDAATNYWGERWSTPSPEQWQELLQNCTFEFRDVSTTDGQIGGVLLTSKKNGKQLFLPTATDRSERLTWTNDNNGAGWYVYLTNARYDNENYRCLAIGHNTIRTDMFSPIQSWAGFVRPVRKP